MKPARYSLFAVGLIISLTVVTNLRGQDSSGSSDKSAPKKTLYSASAPESEGRKIPRVWVGLSGSYTPFRLVSASSQTNSTTGETISSIAANGQAGAGLNVNVRVYGSFWLNLGGVYRFGGYDTNTTLNDANGDVYLERTRARYFDFPLLARYAGRKFNWSKYSFYEAGGALRYASSIKLLDAASNSEGYYCCAPSSTTNIKRTIEGVVVGTGLVGKDDFGIKVAPEVRYIHWMGDTFRSPTLMTMRDQLEVTISFGF